MYVSMFVVYIRMCVCVFVCSKSEGSKGDDITARHVFTDVAIKLAIQKVQFVGVACKSCNEALTGYSVC